MSTTLPSTSQSAAELEYFAEELLREERHEYIAGSLRPVPPSCARHSTIGVNIRALLHSHLRGKVCGVLGLDLKLRLELQTGIALYYPDAMVCCDPADEAEYFRERPVLIVEVLSPESAWVDQREKLLAYQTLPSLEMYVIVDQDRCRLMLHRRANGWQVEFLSGPDEILEVPALSWRVPLREIYRKTGLAG